MRITFGKGAAGRQSHFRETAQSWSNPAAFVQQDTPGRWKDEIRKLLSDENAVILDTETTGLYGDVKIIELSIIDMQGSLLFHSLFYPGILLPEKIPEITGITDEMLIHEPFFFEKADEIAAIIRGKKVIAWNADFDRQRIFEEMTAAGMGTAASALEWKDAMALYSFSRGYRKKWCKLIVAKAEMGISENQEHRSTADCLDTLAVLKAAAGTNENREAKDLFDMDEYEPEEKEESV